MSRSSPKWILSAAALAALGLLQIEAVEAQSPTDAKQTGFELIDDYYLEVNGQPSREASLYASRQTSAILVVSKDLPAPALLWPGSRTVESLQMLKVFRGPNGTAEVLANPVIAKHQPFEVRGGEVTFFQEGVAAALKPKPPLIGLYDASQMLESSRVYAQRAAEYEPAVELVEALRTESRAVRVRVFFGTWCPACGQMVPRMIKVAEQLGEGSKIDVEFYGLPRRFSGEPEATRLGIESVPTGVVFVDGREVGRISGNSWRSPERTLSSMLDAS